MASTAGAPESLSFSAARDRVIGSVRPLGVESVALAGARRRILRESVTAPHALPPFRNSSMDGYALRAADVDRAGTGTPVELPVVEVVSAGRVASRPLAAGEAMRIMTGACVPEGADAVIPFEVVKRLGSSAEERVRITSPVRSGDHIREAGRDAVAGETVLEQGRSLTPFDIAVAASLGLASLRVSAPPRAVLFSTGDELLDVGSALRPGAIRDSNLPMLSLLVEEAGGHVVRAERIPDDPQRVAAAIREGLAGADAVLTVGGVSEGDFDPVKLALREIGDISLWRVAMKPGKPQAFGTPGGKLFYGLPGNPASVACVFEVLVRPALLRMQGARQLDRPRIQVRSTTRIGSRAGRRDFVRVTLAHTDGTWLATPAGEQISGHVLPQARAHALAVVPEAISEVGEGEVLEAIVLRWPDAAA